MSDWLMKTIRGEARRLLEMAADDDELRLDLRALAEEILAATEIPGPADSLPRDRASHGFSASDGGSGRTTARIDTSAGLHQQLLAPLRRQARVASEKPRQTA